MKNNSHILWIASLAAWCLIPSFGRAQLVTNFEPPAYAGSAAGTLLAGQQGWYNPVAGSAEYNAFTYAGNALNLPANPTGGTQFVGAASAGGTAVARGQHDVDFSTAPVWTFGVDVAHRYNGTLPSAQNLASFSTAHTALTTGFRQLIALHTWVDINTATNWNAGYLVFDAAGTAIGAPNVPQSPGAAWNNLSIDNWYRENFVIDFSTNRILEMSMTDLTTGITNSVNPVDWFLLGGAAGVGTSLPTSVRFFTGGALDNVAGWDNLSVQPIPEPSSLVLIGMGLFGVGLRRRFRRK